MTRERPLLLCSLIVFLFLFVGVAPVAPAAEINTTALSQNGWYSDDTRADGAATQAAGTNLVSPTLTDLPEAGSGNPAHDADILAQILFGPAPGVVPVGTSLGAVNLRIANENLGKSTISHRKDDGIGHAPGSVLAPGFFVTYSWMGTGTSTTTAAIKIGFKTSENGSTPISSRTGENAWDKLLIYEPYNNLSYSDGTWKTEATTWTTGKWWIVDRTVGGNSQNSPLTLSDMTTSGYLVNGRTVSTLFALCQAGTITTIQFGVGSYNPTANVYVNEFQTSFYRVGDVTTFGSLPVHNVTQDTWHLTIQDGVDNALPGDLLDVAAGTYEEQVEVTQNVTIQGAGATTIIKSPVTLALGFATSKPVVYVHDTATMALKDLTVDGAGRGNTNYKFIGVAFRNAGGTVENCTVTGIRDTPFSGAQHGVGIYAYNDDGTGRAVTVQGCTVIDFQKNAMALNASDTTPMTVDVTGNVVTGAGPTAVTAQNGIQAWGDLITGTIDDNDVSGIAYSGSGWVATSILIFYADVLVDNNTVTGGHTCIYNIDGDCDITNNDLAVIKTGGYGYGIIATDPPAAKPSPFGEDTASPAPVGVLGAAAGASVLVIDISYNTVVFGGPDNVYTVGIEADAGYGPDDLAVTANNNIVTGFDYGMGFWQCTSSCDVGVFTSIAAHLNDLSGNTSFAFSTNASVVADATCNWWGDADGPDAPPVYSNPAGGSIEGDVIFSPWLVSPTGPCAGANEVVADASALGCIHLTDPCVTVPVMFNRVDTTPLRAVSVTFELSSELELCGSGVQPGTLFDTYGMITPYFYLTDNGGGSYTVDYSILGEPCGPTTGGELFTIDVTASGTASPEDVGTITVVSVDARDCGNPFAAIPAMPGAPAEITIDNAVPTAIASLTAAQLKTGNDADGTTVITVTWPAVEAGASVEVFRKGFGAYPEYDDAGGSVPTAPADPAAAVTAGWISAGVQVSPYADETDTARDFYYYVGFVTDACGNVSAVSNLTSGTLNYHLGDVKPSAATPPFGDNQVELLDVSFLGDHYGVADGNPLYESIMDIGPTTDNSTNGRPTTDNKIQFEDLIILAINYSQVGKPMPVALGSDRNAVALTVASGGVGIEAVVTLSSTGAVQGVSLPLLWNAEAVEPIAVRSGELVSRQSGRALVLSPAPGTVDAAVFGSTFTGTGELAVVTFRVIGAGDPGIRFGEVIARDGENRPVALETTVESRDLPVTPMVTQLLPSAPNPFLGSTQIRFALAEPGEATVRVYAPDGRLVRTLLDASLPAGEKSLTWDGRDEMGRSVAAGTYIVQFRAANVTEAQRMMRLR